MSTTNSEAYSLYVYNNIGKLNLVKKYNKSIHYNINRLIKEIYTSFASKAKWYYLCPSSDCTKFLEYEEKRCMNRYESKDGRLFITIKLIDGHEQKYKEIKLIRHNQDVYSDIIHKNKSTYLYFQFNSFKISIYRIENEIFVFGYNSRLFKFHFQFDVNECEYSGNTKDTIDECMFLYEFDVLTASYHPTCPETATESKLDINMMTTILSEVKKINNSSPRSKSI